MNEPKPITVRCTNKREVQTWEFKHRTLEQFEAVRRIVESEDFDFACFGSNIFDLERWGEKGVGYVGPFSFIYYTKDFKLQMRRIGKRGKILYSRST